VTTKEKNGRVIEQSVVHAEIPGETTAPAKTSAADIPGEIVTPAKTAAATNADIPSTPTQPTQAATPTAPAAGTGEDACPASAADLSKWVGKTVQAGKLTADAVKSVYPQFRVTRLVDLKPEQLEPAFVAIKKAIQDHSAAQTGL
jgi:hypothetical protein